MFFFFFPDKAKRDLVLNYFTVVNSKGMQCSENKMVFLVNFECNHFASFYRNARQIQQRELDVTSLIGEYLLSLVVSSSDT